MEEALRQSEASYRIVTEGSLSGVYVIQDGKFRYVNPMLAQAFGYTPDEFIDRLGPADLVDPVIATASLGSLNAAWPGKAYHPAVFLKGCAKMAR